MLGEGLREKGLIQGSGLGFRLIEFSENQRLRLGSARLARTEPASTGRANVLSEVRGVRGDRSGTSTFWANKLHPDVRFFFANVVHYNGLQVCGSHGAVWGGA